MRGVSKSVFFVRHNSLEENFCGKSKVNILEASFLLRLARHLVRVGNSAKRISLLTAYTGQMLHLMKVNYQVFTYEPSSGSFCMFSSLFGKTIEFLPQINFIEVSIR